MHHFHFVRMLKYNADQVHRQGNKTSTVSSRKKRSVAYSGALWENASTLRISFMGDISIEVRDRIERIIRQWEPFVSLAFEMAEDGTGEIRIAVTGTESYSAIGNNALTLPFDHPTMVIGLAPDNFDFERTVLHEFGHALGFHHAHLHPAANIPWDKPAIYEYFSKTQAWSKEDVDENLFALDPLERTHLGDYDKKSVMHYQVTNFMTLRDWEVEVNASLSEGDKAFARVSYPAINYRALPI